ncbi:SIS domain-containing protein [Parapusillimonas granuli]|uniref:SIS domain-containing protein n=1 Tax=Parapusillimonas granuli TaxID=380911 RepID=UPI0017FED7C6|nr:SIS domain-containing protein [Parapusillimonas granuli]MBB5213631.1 RpiR family carbohydrate utilization transcriptional regulator [Parapusillimonas granuli]MEB2398724.1 SIS domain-containing protein [Alcaligenaceae bacterium]
MTKSLPARIAQDLATLSAAERKVGQLLLDRTHDVAHAALGDVARLAGVSEPTVIRFCRSMGYKGWPDFKIQFAAGLMTGVPYVHSSLNADDGAGVLAAKVMDNAVSALLRARNDIQAGQVDAAIGLISRARRVEFYGVGNSGIVAQDAQHKFFRFDLATAAYSDSHVQLMAASLLGPSDVLVAISHSGRSREILDAVRLARRNRCPVVAITASGTPLADLAGVLLRADTQEDTELYSPMISRLVHLALIDVLALGVALKRGKEASRSLEKTKKSLRNRRSSL